MIYIPTKLLTEGMVPVHSITDINDPSKALTLKGVPLTAEAINNLKSAGVAGCYTESDISGENVNYDCNALVRHSMSLAYVKEALNKNDKEAIQSVVNEAIGNDDSLSNILDIRSYDSCTYEHSLRVMIMCIAIGRQLKLSKEDLSRLATAALLHDVGKLEIPSKVLNKPDKLTPNERIIIEKHPYLGYQHVTEFYDFDRYITDGILYHHERVDGSGYPGKLKGDEIPLIAKIIAVADVFDALTSKRPYREPWYPNEALAYMSTNYRHLFDADVYSAFLKVVTPYPIGSSVLLSDDTVAVVISVNTKNYLRPVLRRIPTMEVIDLTEKKNWNLVIRGMCYTEKFTDALRKGGIS